MRGRRKGHAPSNWSVEVSTDPHDKRYKRVTLVSESGPLGGVISLLDVSVEGRGHRDNLALGRKVAAALNAVPEMARTLHSCGAHMEDRYEGHEWERRLIDRIKAAIALAEAEEVRG